MDPKEFLNPGREYRGVALWMLNDELEVGEMMDKAAAAWELYRELNSREGLGRELDVPPQAWFVEQPLWGRGGRLKDYSGNELSREDVLTLLDDYYDERGRKHG
jgi:aldehyde:ferredoxin oxidoreductase